MPMADEVIGGVPYVTGYWGPSGGDQLPAGFTGENLFQIKFNTAGNYEFEFWLQDLTANNRLADFTGTAIVYTKPVISSTTLAGPYQTGNDQDFTLTITNPSGIPAPFELHFNFPAGTVLVYGGITDTCDAAGCTIPVLLGSASNDLTFTVTFTAPFIGDAVVDLYDSDWTPADRLLASLTQAVSSLPNFTVTGTVSMQGRTARAGVPMALAGLFPVAGATSFEQISNNITFLNVAEGTYTITTNQPRYLNVTAGLNKTAAISASKTSLLKLELKGGNAVYSDNEINILDAAKVGSQFGMNNVANDGDVNFDGKINVQDLALVGGNYQKSSADVYGTDALIWIP